MCIRDRFTTLSRIDFQCGRPKCCLQTYMMSANSIDLSLMDSQIRTVIVHRITIRILNIQTLFKGSSKHCIGFHKDEKRSLIGCDIFPCRVPKH